MKKLLVFTLILSLVLPAISFSAGKVVAIPKKVTLTAGTSVTIDYDLSSYNLEGYFKSRVIVDAYSTNTLNATDKITMYAKPADKVSTIKFMDGTTETLFEAMRADSILVFSSQVLPTVNHEGTEYKQITLPTCNYLQMTLTYAGTAGDTCDFYVPLVLHVGQ